MKITPAQLIVAILLCFQVAHAELTLEAQNLLIDKLTQVFLKLPDGQPSKMRVTLRLADLHAEKGRMVARAELEKGCIQCSNGEADRKKALEYYTYALPKVEGEKRHNVMVQIGHLYELLGKTNEAITFYKKLIHESADTVGVSESLFSLAEIYFKRKNFSTAKTYYEKALSKNTFSRRGLAEYRVAWCDFHSGRISPAIDRIEKILKTPKLLSRGGEAIANQDHDFQAEVAKDYTVFISQSGKINLYKITQVYKLSPDSNRMENVIFLAKELERLGQVTSAIDAWNMVVQKTDKPMVRMEGLIFMANLEYKRNQRDKILPHLNRALSNWRGLSECKTEECGELRKRLRTLVLDWNRAEKKNPSTPLMEAYKAYLTVAQDDMEMAELGSQVAMQRKAYKEATQWNALVLQSALAASKKDKKKIETYLLRQLEIAEITKNDVAQRQAQELYLKESLIQSKKSEIRYQMAQKTYDDKNYQAAADQFKVIAKDKGVKKALRLQSAEMAMDALVLLKNDSVIESWASEFASLFPKKRARFGKMVRNSVLAQTAKQSTNDDQAWSTLSRFDVNSADTQEKITYYKNKAILARKLKKYGELNSAVNNMMTMKGVGDEDRKFAMENKIFVSEIQLDFQTAFKYYKKLYGDKWIELARLADLAETNSSPYYINYLKKEADPELALSICERLIKEQGSFNNKVKPCMQFLSGNKEFFAKLYLELYSKKPNLRSALAFLKRHKLEKTAVGQILTRENLYITTMPKASKLQRHKLDGRSHKVARSLKYRVRLLQKFEKEIAKVTAQSSDWYLQALFLTDMQKEYERFYNELLNLPVPAGLSEPEQQEYLTLLSQQASPYKAKADDIGIKLKEIWSNEKAIDQLFADFHLATRGIQKVIGPQIARIQAIAPEPVKTNLFLVYKTAPTKSIPSLAHLQNARRVVIKNPLDKGALAQLIKLEAARGYEPMVIYLKSRMQKIDEGFEQVN